ARMADTIRVPSRSLSSTPQSITMTTLLASHHDGKHGEQTERYRFAGIWYTCRSHNGEHQKRCFCRQATQRFKALTIKHLTLCLSGRVSHVLVCQVNNYPILLHESVHPTVLIASSAFALVNDLMIPLAAFT